MEFFKTMPYISRVHCYNVEKEKGTLIQITLSKELCNVTDYEPDLSDECDGFSFCDLW